jgi:hypothetical protein
VKQSEISRVWLCGALPIYNISLELAAVVQKSRLLAAEKERKSRKRPKPLSAL